MLPPEITEVTLAANYPALRIKTELCEAVVALHGAHLTHWQPLTTPEPVLYTSPTAIYREGKAIRGGIPLCWPWFNAHPDHPEQHPSHGVARDRFWELESATVVAGVAHLTFVLPPSETISAHVPFGYQLRALYTLGADCRVALETTNLSPNDITIGGALHSYLAVSSIHDITLEGLQGAPAIDTTTSPEILLPGASHPLVLTQELDRIYYETSHPLTLHDPAWGRKITVAKENSLTSVIWNPWSEKAKALGDLPDNGFERFLCIEAANARHDARVLAPQASHCLATTISVTS